MSFASRLHELLPAVYRIRDLELAAQVPDLLAPAERAELQALEAAPPPLTAAQRQRLAELRDRLERGPLRALLVAIGEQVAVLEENLAQLYDDAFVETCAEWAVPYIGDLIGYRTLHGIAPKVTSRRAEVAHTIGFRRRKGTAAMLEQLARDVTGWNARAVEFFQALATSQHMNHVRPQNHYGPDLRRWEPLERLGSAFDTISHTADVRNVGRGRFNIPNVGLFLWRLDAFSLTRSPAVKVDNRRYLFDPRGIDQPLVTAPETEDEVTHIAEPLNVPAPISRRVLGRDLASAQPVYYGAGKSLLVHVAGMPVPAANVVSCNLADDGASWAHLPPAGKFAIDPVLGRLALPPTPPVLADVRVSFHYAFSARIGGGEYEREDSFEALPAELVVRVPDDHATIQDALNALGGAGIVEITDGGYYPGAVQVTAAAGQRVELRARNGRRPTIDPQGPVQVSAAAGGRVVLNGLLVVGQPVRVQPTAANALRRLRIAHCTLVPGRTLAADGTPGSPAAPSLVVDLDGVSVDVDHSIVGGVRVDEQSRLAVADSILDATSDDQVAFAAVDNVSPGGELSLESVTVIGKVHTLVLRLGSNSIFLARLRAGDAFPAPVRAVRKQEGCVRFSYLPLASRVPPRHRCQPSSAAGATSVVPRFTSLRYGVPAYGQLSSSTPDEIRRGAEDEGEMGAFHHLLQPQRESDLRVRLDEYLRVGLQAGVFYET